MTDVSDRYRRVAAAFSERVHAVPSDRWDAPTPCRGWVARDIVRHLAEWVPSFFFGTWERPMPTIPSAGDDPVAAWDALDAALQAALDDPTLADEVRDTEMGPRSFGDAFALFAMNDVLIHTWDLARATGQDEHLDEAEIEAMAAELTPEMGAAMRASEHFGPEVEVPADADAQTRVLAFMGRTP